MGAEVVELYTILTANTLGFQKSMAEAEAAEGKFRTSHDATLASIGKFALGAGVAGLAGAAAITKMAGSFQQQMTLIRTQAGDTTDNLGTLSKQVLALAGTVGQSPDALAAGLFHLASAGFTGKQAFDMLTQGAKLAAVGQSDFETTMQAVIFTMRSGLPDIHSASDAVAMLNAIVGNGDMRMQALTTSLSSGILPVAAQFGVSLQSMGAALAYMTDRGVPADEATTRLRMSMALMAAPTKLATKLMTDAGLGFSEASYRVNAMTEILHKSGVSTTRLADDLRQPDGILVALRDLKTHMTDAGVSIDMQNATISRAFGGGKSGGTIMALYANLDGLQQKYIQLGKSSGDFANAWTIQSQTFDQRSKDAAASAQALAITWGNVLLPAATGLMTFLGDVAQNLAGTGTAASQADGPAKAVAGALHDIGTFAGQAIDKLKPVGQWMLDHKQVVEDIGLGLAAWWAVDKIAGWTTAAGGAITTVLGKIPGVNLGGKGASALVNDTVGMRVFVTNWEMMAGKGIPGVPGGLPAVGATGAAGGEAAWVAGLSGMSVGAMAAVVAPLAVGASIGWVMSHPELIGGSTGTVTGSQRPGLDLSQQALADLKALGVTAGGGPHLAGIAGAQWGDFQKLTGATGAMPGSAEAAQLSKLMAAGTIKTGSQIDTFLKNWSDTNAAAVKTATAASVVATTTTAAAAGSVNWSANYLVQGDVSGSAMVKVADKMSGTAIDTGYIKVATGVLRGNVETLNTNPLWTDNTTLQSISDNVHGVGGDMSLIGTHVSDLEKYANEAALSWQGFMDAMAPYRHFKLGAIRQDGALPGTPGFQGGVTPPAHYATGGGVQANVPIAIGEHGPEVWTPPGNGYITPNSQLGSLFGAQPSGGGQTIQISIQHVDVHGVQDAASLFDELQTIGLTKALGRGAGSLFGQFA